MPDPLLALPFGVAVGLSLGLVGAGGSLLTVPVLVYVLGESAQAATTASLVIVGLTAAAGALGHVRRGTVQLRLAAVFGGTAALGTIGGTALNRLVAEDVLLAAFGVLMLVAALALVRERSGVPVAAPAAPLVKAATAGLAVGVLTGFFGVGGGFVIVPVLALVLRLPFAQAVGTSLAVIAIASAAALAGHLTAAEDVDWAVAGAFAAAAIAGVLLGGRFSRRLPPTALARGFAVLVAGVGTFLVVRSALALS